MPRTRTVFGISMTFQKSRRWLVILSFGITLALVSMHFILSSRIAQFLVGLFTGWGIGVIAIFYELAKETVLITHEVIVRPAGLGLLYNAYPDESKPDERQVAVRNAAYYKAYRILAVCLLSMPILFLSLSTSNTKLLGIYIFSIWAVIFALPRAIILWTEPDIPEEAK
jgi:hypothetical protein